jgi:mRNA interferase RelE/StbE
MASYKIQWKSSAKKELKKLDKQVIPRLLETIEALANNPYPVGCRKIVGNQAIYRVRVGDYRIIYQIQAEALIIVIVRVGHRQNVYSS